MHKQPGDADGVRVFETRRDRRRERKRLAGGVVGIIVLAATVTLVLRLRSETDGIDQQPLAVEEQADARQPAAPPALPKLPAIQAEPAPQVPAQEAVSNPERPPRPGDTSPAREKAWLEAWAQDAIDALKASGEHGGLAAFPPPGTDPLKTGVVVPEDFELPAGYVRHYQITDDGKRLEPILMFSPDKPLVDGNGEPIPLPDDGIVPADMAPPGLPVRMLEVPEAPGASVADSHDDAD